jgi:hypothetical protein
VLASQASATLSVVTAVERRLPGTDGAWWSPPPLPSPAGMVWVATFQPETRTDGAAPRRSAVRYVAVSVVDSPGHRLISLSVHRIGSAGAPDAPSTCASTSSAGILPVPVFFSVRVVVVVPSEPAVDDAVAVTGACAMPDRPVRSAYADCGA